MSEAPGLRVIQKDGFYVSSIDTDFVLCAQAFGFEEMTIFLDRLPHFSSHCLDVASGIQLSSK